MVVMRRQNQRTAIHPLQKGNKRDVRNAAWKRTRLLAVVIRWFNASTNRQLAVGKTIVKEFMRYGNRKEEERAISDGLGIDDQNRRLLRFRRKLLWSCKERGQENR